MMADQQGKRTGAESENPGLVISSPPDLPADDGSPGVKFRFSFGYVVYLFLVCAFAYALYTYRDQLAEIWDVLQRGLWYWIGLTAIVLGLAMYNQALLYADIYDALSLPSSKRELLPLYLVRRFVQVAAPSGGFSGWVPFIQFARRRDISIGAVFVANLIYTILWYSTFAVFLLLGLLFLFIAHDLQWFEISAAIVLLAADLIMIGLFVLAWFAPQVPPRLMRWVWVSLRWAFSLIKRPPPLREQQLHNFASDLSEGITQMRRAGWRRLVVPTGHAFLNETLHLLMFYISALAFGAHLSFGVLVAAYSVSVLFWVVSPTPGGLGFVEGTLIIVLTTLAVPAGQATAITLAYRGITFWLPFILGFIALRWFRNYPEPVEP